MASSDRRAPRALRGPLLAALLMASMVYGACAWAGGFAPGQGSGSGTTSGSLDTVLGSTRGAIPYRGSSGWTSASPGTSTYVWTSNGAAADPSWQAAAGGATPTLSQVLTAGSVANSVISWTTGLGGGSYLIGPSDQNFQAQAFDGTAGVAGKTLLANGGDGNGNSGTHASLSVGGGNSSGQGGGASLSAGTGVSAKAGGAITVAAGDGNLATASGSSFSLNGGSSAGKGGNFQANGGDGQNGQAGGTSGLFAGKGNASAGTGASVLASAGTSAGAGGACAASAGAGIAGTAGGTLTLSSGTGNNGGSAAASIALSGGNSSATAGALTVTGNTSVTGTATISGVTSATVGSQQMSWSASSGKTLAASDCSGQTWDDTGASALIPFTLPTAATGLRVRFEVTTANGLSVTAGASTSIRLGPTVSVSAGVLKSTTIGSTVELEAVSTTKWVAVAAPTGTWTVDAIPVPTTQGGFTTTGSTTSLTQAITAGTLNVANRIMHVHGAGTVSGGATAVSVVFAGTTLVTLTPAATNNWVADLTIMDVDATHVRTSGNIVFSAAAGATVSVATDGTSVAVSTLANAQNLVLNGTACNLLTVEMVNAP